MTDHAPTPLIAFSNAIADLVAHVAPSVVALDSGGRYPVSGLHWRPGLIVTSDEALINDENITVLRPDGQRVAAALVGRDPSTDVALLRFEPDGMPAVEQGDAGALRAGNLILGIGRNQRGVLTGLGVAALAGDVWHSRRGGRIDRFIRLDLSLSPSAEGGAMVDAGGEVLGMIVRGPRRLVLGIPASTIDRVVDQLLAKGHIGRGYLGAGLQPARHGSDAGLLVVSIDPEGPASRNGLLVGDIVLQWNDQKVTRVREVMVLLGPESIGQAAKLAILRAGQHSDVTITIGERPRS